MCDIKYWNNFYNNKEIVGLNKCSDFCLFVMNYIEKEKLVMDSNRNITHILDAGFGNGRDSRMFSEKYKITAIDNSGYIPEQSNNINFRIADFVTADKKSFDLIYSRFTFHSITNDQHKIFLESICTNTYLAIETRSIKGIDDYLVFGKTHFRNYTDIEYIKNLLSKYNFQILYIKEGQNMAVYKDENPFCIRIICRKILK